MSLTKQLIDLSTDAPTDLQTEPEREIAEKIIDTDFRVNGLTAIGKNMFGLVFESRLKGAATPEAKRRRFPIVRDVDGECWDIREVRGTKHGFDLYFGTLTNYEGVYLGGPARVIATKELRDFWEANRTEGHGFLYDLPAGRTTLKRVRRRLGFNFRDDTTEFWRDRVEDLESLPVREFAARHEVSPKVAFEWRRRMVGIRARPVGWWRKAKFRKILLSDLTLLAAGRKLGIGTSHAKRLRDRAKLEARLLLTPVSERVTLANEGNQVRGKA